MTHWNYRVCKKFIKYNKPIYDELGEYSYEIHETYYNKKNEVVAISENAISPFGEDKKQLEGDLKKMISALEKEELDLDTLEFGKPDHE